MYGLAIQSQSRPGVQSVVAGGRRVRKSSTLSDSWRAPGRPAQRLWRRPVGGEGSFKGSSRGLIMASWSGLGEENQESVLNLETLPSRAEMVSSSPDGS